MSDKLNEVVEQIPFGVCPHCRSRLMLLRSTYTAYQLSESGWIEAKIDDKSIMKTVCPKCGYSAVVHVNEKGIVPEGYWEDLDNRKPILNNPIGDKQNKVE